MEPQTIPLPQPQKNSSTPITGAAHRLNTLYIFEPDLIPLEQIFPCQEDIRRSDGTVDHEKTFQQRQAVVAIRRQIVEKVFGIRQYEAQRMRHAAQRIAILEQHSNLKDAPQWQKDDLLARAEHHSVEMGLCDAMREQLKMECWVAWSALVDDGM